MENIYKIIFQYGYHDTNISKIVFKDSVINLIFDEGLYILDEKGKELSLSNPMSISLKLNDRYSSLEEALEIREYGKKIKYIDYSQMIKYLKEDKFGISMVYFSQFNNSSLVDGGIGKHTILLSIEGIDEVMFNKQ